MGGEGGEISGTPRKLSGSEHGTARVRTHAMGIMRPQKIYVFSFPLNAISK